MPQRDVFPAEPGWVALYRYSNSDLGSYPVIAWERDDNNPELFTAIVVNGRAAMRRDDLEEEEGLATFVGYRHPERLPEGHAVWEKPDA